MDVSPPNNRSISSGFNANNQPVINNPGLPGDAPPTSTSFFALSGNSSSNVLAAPLMTDSRSEGPQPFGQSFGQTSQTSLAPGFFAPGPSSNQHAPVPPPVFAGPSSFPSGTPFEAGANQLNPNQFNQSHSNSFNQLNPNQFNQSNPSQFNVNPTSFNQFNSTSFNPDPTSSNSISRLPIGLTSRLLISSISQLPISSTHRHPVHLSALLFQTCRLRLLHLIQWLSPLELHLRLS